MATTTPVVNLSTLVERAHVAIDGARYELKSLDEFPLVTFVTLQSQGARVQALGEAFAQRQPTVDEARELESIVEALCRDILIAPDDVHAKLQLRHRLAIAQAFMQLQSATDRQPIGATPAADQPTTSGSVSYPVSLASTEATPSAG